MDIERLKEWMDGKDKNRDKNVFSFIFELIEIFILPLNCWYRYMWAI